MAGSCILSNGSMISLGRALPVVTWACKSQMCIITSQWILTAAPYEESRWWLLFFRGGIWSPRGQITCTELLVWSEAMPPGLKPRFLGFRAQTCDHFPGLPLLLFFQGWWWSKGSGPSFSLPDSCGAPSIWMRWVQPNGPSRVPGAEQMLLAAGVNGCVCQSWEKQESLGHMAGSAPHRELHNVLLSLEGGLQRSQTLVFS